MSLRAILECAVHVDTFRNIDLFQQGLYLLRISVSQCIDQQVASIQTYPAQPYDLKFLSPTKEHKSAFDSHNVTVSRILDPEMEYCSNAFLVKYCDEEVRIGDICVFRAEVYVGPQFHTFSLDVDIKLMFLEASVNAPFERFKFLDVDISEFTEISRAKVVIRSPCLGVHEYYPLLFDDMHFSTVDLVIHTALLDYRFRPTSLSNQGQKLEMGRLSDRAIDMEMTLAQYLFPEAANGKLRDEDMDRVYLMYVSLLEKGFNELKSLIAVLQKSLSEFELELLQPESSHSHLVDTSTEASLSEILEEPHHPGRKIKFSHVVETRDSEEVTARIMADAHEISAQTYQLYHLLLQICQISPQICVSHFRKGFLTKVKERYGECIFRDAHRVEALPLQSNEELCSLHSSVAKARRGNTYFRTLEPMPVEDSRLVGKPESLPILFEDLYIPQLPHEELIEEEAEVGGREGCVLFVLVHGFQGNSFDMRLFKNHICLLHPTYQFLCSSSNEGNTEGDIIEMGLRLSNEVKTYIQDWCPNNGVKKLSFIGHSLGGLIIRAALPFLSEYAQQMDLFMTLSTPHLGYMYSESKLVDAGFWLLKKWRKSLCLTQLSMGDGDDLRNSTLYRMSSFEGVQWFNKVVLFSSTQDQYAPFDSARVEVSTRATNDLSRGCYYIEMASKLLSQVGIEKLKRIDVNFKFTGKSVDSMIGLKAHIEFLENQMLMKIVVFSYPELFA